MRPVSGHPAYRRKSIPFREDTLRHRASKLAMSNEPRVIRTSMSTGLLSLIWESLFTEKRLLRFYLTPAEKISSYFFDFFDGCGDGRSPQHRQRWVDVFADVAGVGRVVVFP